MDMMSSDDWKKKNASLLLGRPLRATQGRTLLPPPPQLPLTGAAEQIPIGIGGADFHIHIRLSWWYHPLHWCEFVDVEATSLEGGLWVDSPTSGVIVVVVLGARVILVLVVLWEWRL